MPETIVVPESVSTAVSAIKKRFHLTDFERYSIENAIALELAEVPIRSAKATDDMWLYLAGVLKGPRSATSPVGGWSIDSQNELAIAIRKIYNDSKT
jgi:hypothetical protein